VFWRWSNVFLVRPVSFCSSARLPDIHRCRLQVQILWAIEIRLGAHMDEDATVEARWKTE
jgi:hypothetical protein